jgi:hypothetical protein
MRPIAWRGKALTLRGEGGTRPVLERQPSQDDAPWQALLHSDRDLSLEGLELRHSPGLAHAEGSLICCEGAALRLRDCRLKGEGRHPTIVCRQGTEVSVNQCAIETVAGAIAVEVGQAAPCRVQLFGSRIRAAGAALALWAPETSLPMRTELRLEGNTIAADRVVSVRALPGPLCVEASGNQLTFRDLFHFHAERGRGDWRRLTTWSGRDNRFDGGLQVRVEGEEHSLAAIHRGAPE